MNQIWSFSEWCNFSMSELKDAVCKRARSAPRVGDMSVRQLCSPALDETCPVGLYVFTDESASEILYVGKTHGRSLHERLISHIDHRDPTPGSPHMARLVSYLVETGRCQTRSGAVDEIMKMRALWLPIPRSNLTGENHKRLIAIVERRLLWKSCLDPTYNSDRVKRSDSFSVKGTRYFLLECSSVGKIPKTLLST